MTRDERRDLAERAAERAAELRADLERRQAEREADPAKMQDYLLAAEAARPPAGAPPVEQTNDLGLIITRDYPIERQLGAPEPGADASDAPWLFGDERDGQLTRAIGYALAVVRREYRDRLNTLEAEVVALKRALRERKARRNA